MNDRPYEAVLSDPDADDIVAVGDELQNVAPIEDTTLFSLAVRVLSRTMLP